MIDDCKAGNIDMVITKSTSRFARNTLDCLKYIRQLKDMNIPVLFEKESINTMDAKGEVLITIMASLAQQESQSLSQNVKLGLQYRYQQGKVQINHNRFLGYTKDTDGNLIIDPEQAEIVKRIYREYLEGLSMDKIAAGLECHARTINELVLQDAVVKAINQMLGDKSNYQAQLQLNIASVIRASQATSVENIDEKLMALQQELIQKAQSKEAYDEIADEIFRLRELRQQTTVDTAARDEQIKRINDLQDYIAQQTTHLIEFNESLVRRWIKQITIWDDLITVELKSGVSIDVDA